LLFNFFINKKHAYITSSVYADKEDEKNLNNAAIELNQNEEWKKVHFITTNKYFQTPHNIIIDKAAERSTNLNLVNNYAKARPSISLFLSYSIPAIFIATACAVILGFASPFFLLCIPVFLTVVAVGYYLDYKNILATATKLKESEDKTLGDINNEQ